MKRLVKIILAKSLLLSLIMISCGGNSQNKINTPSTLLIESFASGDITRTSEIRTFVGEALYEYINGGAEFYHLYHFTDIATADYKASSIELVADIYRFENSEYAFGLYSSMRPDGAEISDLGIEGFFTGNSLDFVKGEFLVRIIGYDDSGETSSAIRKLASNIELEINGSSALPTAFDMFPTENLLSNSEIIFAESYLGRIYLTKVYTRHYQIDDETITLFISEDKSGQKFIKWSEDEEEREILSLSGSGVSSTELLSFSYDDNYYDKVSVSLYHGRLMGIVNYNDNISSLFESWIMSIE